MKSLLISIRPEFVAKILNGKKTIEIRKTAPKCDLPIDVYIYCTEPHAEEALSLFVADVRPYVGGRAAEFIERKRVDNPGMRWSICNGRVAAKFTLREVKAICIAPFGELSDEEEMICSESCVPLQELVKYLRDGMFGYSWRISDLQIFDEPKHLKDFGFNRCEYSKCINCEHYHNGKTDCSTFFESLSKVPQSWCYVEARK